MSSVDARSAQIAMEIDRDWSLVEQHTQRAQSVDPAAGPAEAALVAVGLDHAYEAFETILIRIERVLGLPERSGPNWHADILRDAGWPLRETRPAVYCQNVARDWQELLRFRHFFRHAYALDLEPQKLVANAERLQNAVAATAPLVRALVDVLVDSSNLARMQTRQ